MSRSDFEDWTAAEFSFLQDHAFLGPSISRSAWRTVIFYRKHGLGVEIVMDWRDRDFSVMLVKLAPDGSLPKGYLVYEGKRVRAYLLNWLNELGLFHARSKPVWKKNESDEDKMKSTVSFLAHVLRQNMDVIERKGQEAFE